MIILESSAEQQELCEIMQEHCMSIEESEASNEPCNEHRARHAQYC